MPSIFLVSVLAVSVTVGFLTYYRCQHCRYLRYSSNFHYSRYLHYRMLNSVLCEIGILGTPLVKGYWRMINVYGNELSQNGQNVLGTLGFLVAVAVLITSWLFLTSISFCRAILKRERTLWFEIKNS